MISSTNIRAEDGFRGRVIDLDTGRRVPKVIELNLERGYLRAYEVIKQDDERPEREIIRRSAAGEPLWYEAYGRFQFFPGEAKAGGTTPRVVMGAPACARCRSPLTLPGDDLCPRCRAADRGQANRFVIERLTTPLLNCRCAECTRIATWSVADEVEVTPARSGRYLYERGMTVGRRYYCDRCYRPARLLDPKGEIVADFRYAGPDVLSRGAS